MVKGYSRGHEIYFDGVNWRYFDNNEVDSGKRACKKCGKAPTTEGHDACLGHIEGVIGACCGHGMEDGYIYTKNGRETLKLKETRLK